MRYFFSILLLAMIALSSNIVNAAGEPGTVGLGLKAAILYNKMPSGGLELGWNVNRHFTLSVGVLGSGLDAETLLENEVEDTAPDVKMDIEKAQIKRSLLQVGARYFVWGETFNVGLGASSGSQNTILKATTEGSGEIIDEDIKHSMSTVDFTIGNTWRWKYGYVGCDWVGYSGYIGGKEKRESKSTVDEDSNYGKGFTKFLKLNKDMAETGGPIFIAFRAGIGF